jgi:hypothetical protein
MATEAIIMHSTSTTDGAISKEPKNEPFTTTITTPESIPATPVEKPKGLPWYSLSPNPWYRPVLLIAIVTYGANVIAWGGMLFLLLVGAAPAMCHPSCNDIDSPRRKWIEWDSQILNALFCVTGFGLSPWRFRDMYFLGSYYFKKAGKERTLLRLVGWHSWFRLGQNLPEEEARRLQSQVRPRSYFSLSLKGTDPARNPPANLPVPLHLAISPWWKLILVVLMNFMNTAFQICLATFMWADNRYVRPSWATGLFVALGCIAGIVGGTYQGMEGSRCAKIEQGIQKKPKKSKEGEKTDVEAQTSAI